MSAVSTLDARLQSFTLSVTGMLLVTDLTSTLDDKSIGVEYCKKIREKVLPIPILMLHTKSIAVTCANNQKVSPIPYQYSDINNADYCFHLLSYFFCKYMHTLSCKAVCVVLYAFASD